MNKQTILYSILIAALFMMGAAAVSAERVAVSHMGYHPSSHKQVVVYEPASDHVMIGDNQYPLIQTTCQGGQDCKIAEFNDLTAEGTYTVTTEAGTSGPQVTIDSGVYQQQVPTLLEFFQANMQQGSDYHADLNKNMNPPFTIQADGSPIMEADQDARTLIRLANAYRRNPALFTSDRYTITSAGQPDMLEYIKEYTDYLASLQDHDGTPAVSMGWNNDFQCPWDVDPNQERWDGENPCMTFHAETTNEYTAMSALAFAMAVEPLNDLDPTAASQTLARTQTTVEHLQGQSLNEDEKAYLGASLFLLYDHTGNEEYLQEAHALKDQVSQEISVEITRGGEYYWEQYIQHKAEIQSAGLSYGNPEAVYTQKLLIDWDGRWQDPISGNGERVFEYSRTTNFHTSRQILMEGLHAAKAREFADNNEFTVIADQQLAWMTGQNSVESDDSDGAKRSYSFIFGIGDEINPTQFHSRLLPWAHYNGEPLQFSNGKTIIPGWVSGAFDIDRDGVFNTVDHWNRWRFSETTNEMVAESIELMAYLDAQRAGTTAPPPTTIDPTDPGTGGDDTDTGDDNTTDPDTGDDTNTTDPGDDDSTDNSTDPDTGDENTTDPDTGDDDTNTCLHTVADLPASCNGEIMNDTFDGCRNIICEQENASLSIKACDTEDGFEMYRQAINGTGTEICLGETCISEAGFASGTLPYCPADETGTDEDTGTGNEDDTQTGNDDADDNAEDDTEADSEDDNDSGGSGGTGGGTTTFGGGGFSSIYTQNQGITDNESDNETDNNTIVLAADNSTNNTLNDSTGDDDFVTLSEERQTDNQRNGTNQSNEIVTLGGDRPPAFQGVATQETDSCGLLCEVGGFFKSIWNSLTSWF